MKARVKATGVIIEVDKASDGMYYQSECSRTISDYSADELEFIPTPQKQSVTIEGWVCRDSTGVLLLSGYPPLRCKKDKYWQSSNIINIPTDSFPDLKWEDDPKRVKLTIEEI